MPSGETNMRRAFTLIELLVVVAIIGLLIAILLPTLSAARDTARTVKCQTQLREYARGFQYYLAEYNDVFPAVDYGIDPNAATGEPKAPTWFQLIDRYWIGSEATSDDPNVVRKAGEAFGLARCPALIVPRESNGIEWEWKYSWRSLGYGYNRYWLGYNNFYESDPAGLETAPTRSWRPASHVKRTAECLLVADCQVRPWAGNTSTRGNYVGWPGIARRTAGVDTRHGATSIVPSVPSTYNGDMSLYLDGAGSIAWVDGHVSLRESPKINSVDDWRFLWDPEQGRGGY